jgi:hypothetical protein
VILPTKHIPEDKTLLGIGALLLSNLSEDHTVSSLWETARKYPTVGTFDRYVLALDLLHLLGVIDLHEDGLLARSAK